MKILPVQRYKAFRYPLWEQVQQNPALLKNVPARWEKAPGFAAMLGLLALSANSRAAAEDGVEPIPVEVAPEGVTDKTETGQEVRKTTAVVAPILADALEHDGRGSFGCISVCPATFLPEDEALELIRAELEAAGLHVRDGVRLDGVQAPVEVTEQTEAIVVPKDDKTSTVMYGFGSEKKVLGSRPFIFDFADEEKSVFIEYLSKRDYREWGEERNSTAEYIDFPDLAQKVSEAFGKKVSERQTVFGVFFDPLAPGAPEHNRMEGLTPRQKNLIDAEWDKALRKDRTVRGRERLRAQVRYFIEFLRKEGLVSAMK
jgi:hypothetical protein